VGTPTSPGAMVSFCLKDLRSLSSEQQQRTRYLSLFYEGLLIRLDIDAYGWKASTWDQLADVEPYHYAKLFTEVEENVRYGTPDGRGGHVNVYVKREKVRKEITALAPWLPTKEVQEIITLTQSRAPVVHGHWFLSQTAVNVDRKPGYYDFLGVKNQKGFEDLIGFDEKLFKKFDPGLLESVALSRITLQPRRIARDRSAGGGYWQTFDNRLALDKKDDQRNPLRTLNGGFKFDAVEAFAPLPNGMMGWLLVNNKGELQDNAPDFIVRGDYLAGDKDRRVHVNLACIRCHGSEGEGVQSIDGWARNLFTPPPFELRGYDYDQVRKLRQQYLRKLEPFLEDDRRIYTRAVQEATGGWKVSEWGLELIHAFDRYEHAEVNLAYACRQLSCTEGQFVEAIKRMISVTGTADSVLANFLKGDKAQAIGIRQFEEVYGLAQQALHGIVVPAEVKK